MHGLLLLETDEVSKENVINQSALNSISISSLFVKLHT